MIIVKDLIGSGGQAKLYKISISSIGVNRESGKTRYVNHKPTHATFDAVIKFSMQSKFLEELSLWKEILKSQNEMQMCNNLPVCFSVVDSCINAVLLELCPLGDLSMWFTLENYKQHIAVQDVCINYLQEN
jgi:hypothetical protein